MIFLLLAILLIFVIGLIVSKGSIRRVFLSGLRFIFMAFALIAAVVWILFQYKNATKSKKPESTYDHSAYVRAQQNKKADAIRVGNELRAITKTLFQNETCYRVWGDTGNLVTEIYKKYEEDLEWGVILPAELLTLIDEGFAEASGNEVVVFHKKGLRPLKPSRRNEAVRKTTVPLSEYYYGPSAYRGDLTGGYLTTIQMPKEQLIEARKQLDYRRKLVGEELQKYNALYKAYEKYEAEGLYKRQECDISLKD